MSVIYTKRYVFTRASSMLTALLIQACVILFNDAVNSSLCSIVSWNDLQIMSCKLCTRKRSCVNLMYYFSIWFEMLIDLQEYLAYDKHYTLFVIFS
jgi:hypothetical protein